MFPGDVIRYLRKTGEDGFPAVQETGEGCGWLRRYSSSRLPHQKSQKKFEKSFTVELYNTKVWSIYKVHNKVLGRLGPQ